MFFRGLLSVSVVKNSPAEKKETWVQPLAQENPTCHRATKPMCLNYRACAPELGDHGYRACAPEPGDHGYRACAPEPGDHGYRACAPEPGDPRSHTA